MDQRPSALPTIGAFLVFFVAIGTVGLSTDHTPLLTEPRPELDPPLALLGIAAGFWAALRITRLPGARERRARWALWIMLPLWLSIGLAALGDRLHERLSFRRGGSLEEATVLVVEKEKSGGRRGHTRYEVGIVNPVDESTLEVRVDQRVYDEVEPNRECVTVLIERAPNGAKRLLRPTRWKARCPWTTG